MTQPKPAISDAADQWVTFQENLDRLPFIQSQFAQTLCMTVLATDQANAKILPCRSDGQRDATCAVRLAALCRFCCVRLAAAAIWTHCCALRRSLLNSAPGMKTHGLPRHWIETQSLLPNNYTTGISSRQGFSGKVLGGLGAGNGRHSGGHQRLRATAESGTK